MSKQIKLLLSFGLLIAGFSLISMEKPEPTAESPTEEKEFEYLLTLPKEMRFQIYDQLVAGAPMDQKLTVLYDVASALKNKQILAEVKAYMNMPEFRAHVAPRLAGINLANLVYLYIESPSDDQLEQIEKLIDLGIDLNSKEMLYGTTALIWAARNGRGILVDMLIKKKADLNLTDYDGDTALILAARHGRGAIVNMLIQAGAQLNKKNNTGITALMMAAGYGHEAIVGLLIEKKADLNLTDYDGDTALIFASMEGYESIVEKLIAAEANPTIRNNKGETAGDLAKTQTIRNILLEAEKAWHEPMAEKGGE